MKKNQKIILGFVVSIMALLVACAGHETVNDSGKKISRKTASLEQPPLEFDERWDDSNNAQTQKIIAINVQLLTDRTKNESFVYRDAHPKQHGCPAAYFDIDSSSLPPELRVGVFSSQEKIRIPAWVRFSNGDPDGEHAPDSKKDIRGMAIKLMNVSGSNSGSQDFVMMTAKDFFSKDADDYMKLHEALSSKSKTAIPLYLAKHLKEAFNLKMGQQKPANPLQVKYFSSVPYKLGPRSMKFKAIPCESNDVHDVFPGKKASLNFLRERLAQTLKSKQVCYDFYVQPNMDPKANPIENPMLFWDENVSPYIKVATLNIPVQSDVDSPEHLNFCENLVFDPWHSMPETRPLGQINRMRQQIYPAITELRHRVNNIPIIEPKSHDACLGETAPLCQAPKR